MKTKIEKKFKYIFLMILMASFTVLYIPMRGNSTNVESLPFSISASSTQDTIWPPNSSEWTLVAPEEQELNSSKISEMFEFIESNSYDVQSVIIVRNGYLLTYEYLHESQIYRGIDDSRIGYYGGFTLHPQQSMVKSVTSILIGIALQEGFLDNLSQTLYEFYADIWDPSFTSSELKKNITIEQLLTMTSGFSDYGHPSYPADAKTATGVDCIKFALDDVPLWGTPGEVGFHYTSDGPNLLSGIIANVSGMSTAEFAQEYLFNPLGISENETYWWSDDKGMNYGGYAFDCSPKVQAKIGILALNNGKWNGVQLVDLNFMKKATQSQVREAWTNYGYLWWIMDSPLDPINGYAAIGAGGQNVYVIPEYNIIVGFTASFTSDVDYETLLSDYILQFVEIDQPEVAEDPVIPGFSLNTIIIMIFGTIAVLMIRFKKRFKN